MSESEMYYQSYPNYDDQNAFNSSSYLYTTFLQTYDVSPINVLDAQNTFQETTKNMTMKKFPIQLRQLNGLMDPQVDFKTPLKLIYVYEPDTKLHFFQNSDLNISYSNSDYEKGLNEVVEEISVLWKEIVMAEDSELTSDALRIKRYLLSIKK